MRLKHWLGGGVPTTWAQAISSCCGLNDAPTERRTSESSTRVRQRTLLHHSYNDGVEGGPKCQHRGERDIPHGVCGRRRQQKDGRRMELLRLSFLYRGHPESRSIKTHFITRRKTDVIRAGRPTYRLVAPWPGPPCVVCAVFP
ncbi:hypothetical protein DPEC_G00188430 [Dallia pectoralis]|uniref:Uncharacterized protein n=1 Tax=Dallia pectoralis TaxID=75939 RepID=A0ACC2GBX7_DALPE|nr:hypothetical protein DPEC_G00188430 [Dallia pectoralis]